MSTIQAQDVVNAAIQDSQSQTTNRAALYDYTDRIHQRILRESQWRFLLSDPQVFSTLPGVGSYSVVSTTPPAGVFKTNLNLSDFANIAPGSVFNLTYGIPLEEDSDTVTVGSNLVFKDGSLRSGSPKTYSNFLAAPGAITLKPVPDSNNVYYPVPETPEVTSTSGGSLPPRIYYGVVTFQDSLNGESTMCTIPFTMALPQGSLLVVSSPNPTGSGIAGNQAIYGWWNLYIGYSVGSYYRQNVDPIPLGISWTEPVTGIGTGVLPVPSAISLPPSTSNTVLSILPTGQLGTTNIGSAVVPAFWAIRDTNGADWQVTIDPMTGMLETTPIPSNPSLVNVFPVIYLTDTSNIHTWAITVGITGILQASVFSTPPASIAINAQPPTTPTIQPMNSYIIQFRYYQTRNRISAPTDVLQIPYNYKDIVIAGVNYLANMYLDRNEAREPSAKTLVWKRDFEEGLAQIRRDLRINFRKSDFIRPDTAAQTTTANQQGLPTLGW